jgi:uncharacterized small protein (DUF1192 family)
MAWHRGEGGRRRAVPFAAWAFAFALALAVVPALARAQSVDDRIQALEREVAALQAEVAALKGGGQPAAGDRLAELERRIEVLAGEIERLRIGEAAAAPDRSEHGLGPAASKIYRTERGLSVGGYGELRYQHAGDRGGASVDEEEGSSGGDRFDLQRAVLYFGHKWNDRWLFNSEVEFEHVSDEVSVEFAYLDYLWRPRANFRAGLLLLPVGFLNELHEPTVFLGADRPAVETFILPTTWKENGFGLFGDLGPVSYRTYVVAGFDAAGFAAGGLRGGRQEGMESKAEDLAWVGRLDYKGVPGLLVGASAYRGNSGQGLRSPDGRSLAVATTLLEGHAEWRWRGLELRALGARAELGDVAALDAALGLTGERSIGERLEGYYLQLGYDLLAGRGGERALTPYARWEKYDTQARVPAGFARDPENDVESWTLGLAYKPFEQVVLKLDYQSVHNAERSGSDQFHVVLGYIF